MSLVVEVVVVVVVREQYCPSGKIYKVWERAE